jgi:hypothetical protein
LDTFEICTKAAIKWQAFDKDNVYFLKIDAIHIHLNGFEKAAYLTVIHPETIQEKIKGQLFTPLASFLRLFYGRIKINLE